MLKRKRHKMARKIAKRTGLNFGAAIRIAKQTHVGIWGVHLRSEDNGWIDVPTFCDCCGPEWTHAKIVGPKGEMSLKECVWC